MKVGLYIPCYNAEGSIQYCLEAALKQKYPLQEIVVIDDGSTDQTVDIVSQYPVKLIKHDSNKGLASSRNTAIRNMDSEFIASLDSDCVPEPDWLGCLMKRFVSPKIAGVGGRLIENSTTTIADSWRSVHMKQHWGQRKMSPPFLFGANSVFRKKAILEIGYYNKDLRNNYEDVDISNRLKEKGYKLIYEPSAKARHLKRDNIYSLFNTYWRWNLPYYKKRKFYSNTKRFLFKVKDNIGLANRYIGEDLASRNRGLIYLDFLLSLHHSLKDFEYFVSKQERRHINGSLLPLWLSLIDLTFFVHFDIDRKNLRSLIRSNNSYIQNYFSLNLILGKCIKENFGDAGSIKILYKDLLKSVYNLTDDLLLERLLNLASLDCKWDVLLKKRQPNLNNTFLEKLSLGFAEWLKVLRHRFPGVIKIIEISAKKTALSDLKGGKYYENQ